MITPSGTVVAFVNHSASIVCANRTHADPASTLPITIFIISISFKLPATKRSQVFVISMYILAGLVVTTSLMLALPKGGKRRRGSGGGGGGSSNEGPSNQYEGVLDGDKGIWVPTKYSGTQLQDE
ncbi:hypothetical protein BCR44DRAFT_74332 [Catenaria anguillulae PL171]|uniref:Uncharacterized protein n=1 Tax=Catenaria anguillulae PL171 TaxID=765915 RepID=A0A1Y2H687_9FUNG|nr:hypothetical protein BCR44DRAFT_74332 [Catenaria anguillulae PL171]